MLPFRSAAPAAVGPVGTPEDIARITADVIATGGPLSETAPQGSRRKSTYKAGSSGAGLSGVRSEWGNTWKKFRAHLLHREKWAADDADGVTYRTNKSAKGFGAKFDKSCAARKG